MAQYVSTEDRELEQVASNLGWSEFCEWVATLDVETYPSVHHLARFGYDNDPGMLMEELDAAVEASPPSPDVEDVAEGLSDFLETHLDAEIVIISDGMTSGGAESEDASR